MANKGYNRTYYNYGSAAPDIYREEYQPKVPSTRKKKKSRLEHKEEKRQKFRRRLGLTFSFGMVFIACTTFVWGCAVVSYKQHELQQAKTEVRELKNQVNTTKSLIASSTNLDHIKERAVNELNMAEPLAHQIIFLDISKLSYTVTD